MTDKIKLLQIGQFPEDAQNLIDAQFNCILPAQLDQSPQLRIGIRGIVTRSNYRISEEIVRSLPNLGIIATCGVGYDGIPVKLAHARDVVVTNTPDVLNSAVAELTVGLILALLRRLPAAHRYVHTNRWPEGPFPLGESLAGKHVGIVGYGRIGKSIAERLSAFGAHLAYHGRRRQPVAIPYEPDLWALARDSDILVLAAPGGQATTHLINAQILSALGPAGYLVNIARGSLVNEADLVSALSGGTIAGAALDVYAAEPHVNQELLKLDNVILTPHMGSATHQTRLAMAELTLSNLHRFFAGEPVLTPVSS